MAVNVSVGHLCSVLVLSPQVSCMQLYPGTAFEAGKKCGWCRGEIKAEAREEGGEETQGSGPQRGDCWEDQKWMPQGGPDGVEACALVV